MEQIAGNIANIARNIEIVGADPITLHGFTQVPNFLLTNKELSVGAKLAYAMLSEIRLGRQGELPRPSEACRGHGRGRAKHQNLPQGA